MNDCTSFNYPGKPIASSEKLALLLGISLEDLIFLQKNADSFYF